MLNIKMPHISIHKLQIPLFIVLTSAGVILFVALAVRSIFSSHALAVQKDTLTSLSFAGTYSVDGRASVPITGTTIATDFSKPHTVIFRGHFTSDIPAGTRMIIKLKYLTVHFSTTDANGKTAEFFSYGDTDTRPYFRKTGGFLFQQFNSPGLTAATPVVITVSNIYTLDARACYSGFLSEMYAGSVHELFLKELRIYWMYPAFGLFFVTFGFVILLFVRLTNVRTMFEANGSTELALITIFGGFWNGFIYELFSLIFPYPALADLIAYTCYYVLAALLPLFFSKWFLSNLKYIALGVFYFASAAAVTMLVLQNIGKEDMLGKTMFLYMTYYSIIIPLMIAFTIYEAIFLHNGNAVKILISTGPLGCCLLFSVAKSCFHSSAANYPIELFGSAFFVISQLIFILKRINMKIIESIQLQAEKSLIIENRMKIMLSKIQPHFLYNALTTIKGLAMTDTDKACEAIDDFSFFLRGNMDSLSAPGLIPFDKELEHTKQYLSLEKMRFGTRLNIVYDFQITSFSLPPLTLQPIVENAVRYGVTKKEEGGTVTISTKQDKKNIILTVSDNGVGFDPLQKKEDGRSHIGIQNVRDRIRIQCGGELTLKSTPGKGTVAIITLPAEGGIQCR